MYKSAGIIPTLYGARVSLRPLSAAHAAVLYEIWTHPAVGLWLDAPPLASAAEAEQLIELLLQMSREEESLRWSIVLPGGEIIGSCGFNQWQLAGAYRGSWGVSCLLPAGGRDICGRRLRSCWNSASSQWD